MWRDMLFVQDSTYVLPLPEKRMALMVEDQGEDGWQCSRCGRETLRGGCAHIEAARVAQFHAEKLFEFSGMESAVFDAYYQWWPKRDPALREEAEDTARYQRADAFFQALSDSLKERRRKPNPNPAPEEDALDYMYAKQEEVAR
jgi:hypothetical protein